MGRGKERRADRYITQPTGYGAFIPDPLSSDFPLRITPDLQVLLSAADRAIGRLDAAKELLPNLDLFVAMCVRREAVLSSQIEGTHTSLIDLLEFEAVPARKGTRGDVQEVVDYVEAMNYGLERPRNLPLLLSLIREIHAQLLAGVRGGHCDIGEFRCTQNWVGPRGCLLAEAVLTRTKNVLHVST